MASKTVTVPDIGEVKLYKRRDARGIKLSIGSSGVVRVTLPIWAPYRVGQKFAESRASWIREHRPLRSVIAPDQRVGKVHQFIFVRSLKISKPRAQIIGQRIVVKIPAKAEYGSPEVQSEAQKGAIKALKQEAAQLLPQRLEALAQHHGFRYRSVKIKQLKGRWGSCSQQADIVLNCFLMQLPWELIDYVLLHELMHTRVMSHGKPFWSEMQKYVADLDAIRQKMKQHQPAVMAAAE